MALRHARFRGHPARSRDRASVEPGFPHAGMTIGSPFDIYGGPAPANASKNPPAPALVIDLRENNVCTRLSRHHQTQSPACKCGAVDPMLTFAKINEHTPAGQTTAKKRSKSIETDCRAHPHLTPIKKTATTWVAVFLHRGSSATTAKPQGQLGLARVVGLQGVVS